MLSDGTPAPDFELPDHTGRTVRLSDFRGRWVAMWWYPKASSGTCSVQGKGFCSTEPQFAELDAQVIGLSFDPPDENREFAETQGFGFPLLSDVDATVGARYQVTREPDEKFADKPRRISYVIDPDGVIARSYLVENDEAETDARRLLADIRALRSQREQPSPT